MRRTCLPREKREKSFSGLSELSEIAMRVLTSYAGTLGQYDVEMGLFEAGVHTYHSTSLWYEPLVARELFAQWHTPLLLNGTVVM